MSASTLSAAETREPHPFSLSDLSFWTTHFDEREEVFRELRANAPVTWHKPIMAKNKSISPGYWALASHKDVVEVSNDSARFSSAAKGVMFDDVEPEINEPGSSFLAMDDPRHATLRKLVSVAFTPKRLRRFQEQIDQRATWIVDQLLEKGDCDFVQNVARQMPMWAISELVGIPEEQREAVSHWTDVEATGGYDTTLTGGMDPEQAGRKALGYLRGAGMGLAEARRWHPEDDLMTDLVNAEVDGQKLTDSELGAFFNLLAVAGNDTTRNALAHTLIALTRFPEQRALLMEDFDGRIDTAIDEFLRWATPVQTFARTAMVDTELSGVPIAAGEKVVMFYGSANRDESVFENPMTFDITRTENPHVAFGGGGTHFCMGSMLARAEIKTLLRELFTRVPNIEAGEVTYSPGVFVHGVATLECKLNL